MHRKNHKICNRAGCWGRLYLLAGILLAIALPWGDFTAQGSEIYILPLRAPADETRLNSKTYAYPNLQLLVHIPADRLRMQQEAEQISGFWDLYYIDQDGKFVSFGGTKVLSITKGCGFNCYYFLDPPPQASNEPVWGFGFPRTIAADSPNPFTRFLTKTDWHVRLVEIQRENTAEKDSFLVLQAESWGKGNETIAILRGENFYYQTIPWSNKISSTVINAKQSIPQLYEIASSDSTILNKKKISSLYGAEGSFRLFYQEMNEPFAYSVVPSPLPAALMLDKLHSILRQHPVPPKLYLNPEADAFYILMTYVLTPKKVNTYEIRLDTPGSPPSATRTSELKWAHVSWQEPASSPSSPESEETVEAIEAPKSVPNHTSPTINKPPPLIFEDPKDTGWIDNIINHPVISFLFFLAVACVMIGGSFIWRNLKSAERSEMRRNSNKKGVNYYVRYDSDFTKSDRPSIDSSEPKPESAPEPKPEAAQTDTHPPANYKQEFLSFQDSINKTLDDLSTKIDQFHPQNLTQQINGLQYEVLRHVETFMSTISRRQNELEKKVGDLAETVHDELHILKKLREIISIPPTSIAEHEKGNEK